MTRKQFEKRAIRTEEIRFGLPAGWWGTYQEVQGPVGQRVPFGVGWTVSLGGKFVSRHDSREYAIAKARKLRPS